MRHEPCSLAQSEIEGLEAEGVKLTASDILRIQALALRVEKPHVRIALARGRPVAVGGSYLWPLTLSGAEWFREIGAVMGGEKQQTLALAYAMAHCHAPMPADPVEAKAAVGAWAKTLHCRHAGIVEAIKEVCAGEEMLDTGETGDPATGGDISLMLAAMTRTDPAVWEFQVSLPYALSMLETIIAQNAAEGASSRSDPRIKAERALGLAVHRIRERTRKAAAA